jgi:hypothetical protein
MQVKGMAVRHPFSIPNEKREDQ